MDEESLKAAIDVYSVQLQQVDGTLQAGLEPSQHADLLKLRDDLKQLIELTESSLLSVRKSKAVAELQGESHSTLVSGPPPAEQEAINDEYAAFQAAIAELSGEPQENSGWKNEASPLDSDNLKNNFKNHLEDDNSPNEEEEEEEEDVVHGMKAKAPFYTPWGTLEYHNAMIVEAEDSEDGDAKVRVLYLYPTHKSMRACPFFLEGKCRFKENCRFSHGEVVRVSELKPFEEPDLSSLEVGSACLAKHEDSLWYSAKITDLDSGYYTVAFDSRLLKEAVVEGDAVIPPMRNEEPCSSSSESGEEDEEESAYAKVLDPGTSGSGKWTPACSSLFGGWEAHTRGIGSKLMAKMGYEFGKGLGRNAEGQVEPVLAVVLPKGKSLDQCAAILQKKKEGKLDQQKPKKHRRKAKGGTSAPTKNSRRSTVFDFLNEKLAVRGRNQMSESSQAPVAERNSRETFRASKSSKRALNIRLFQTAEKIDQTQKDIGKIREALARNIGRDKVMTSHLEDKLASAQKQLTLLKAQEASIQRDQKKAETHKKMTVF